MPKKQQTEKEKKQSREKSLRREFGNSPSYTNKSDLKYYNDNKEQNEYGKVSYMVQSGPAIAKQSPSVYGLIEQQYPRIGFYTYMPKDNNNLENDKFRDYIGKSMLYRWNLGSGFLKARHEPEVAVPGEKNYPRIVQEFVDLSNMSGHPAYVGQSPELSKQLPELVVTPDKKYFIVRQQKNGGTMKKLIPKHQKGKSVERKDNTNIKQERKRNLTKEQYYYYNNLINKSFPTTFDKIKQDLVNRGILPGETDYSVPVGYLGDGYHSVVVQPEVQYGPYDLPQLTVNGWGRTLDPEYSEDEWKDIVRRTIQNDTTLSLSDATKYMWAINHPEFKLHPMIRQMATPVQPGPWDRVLYTSGEYEGYLPSDNPKYGGEGIKSWDWEYPSRSTTYKTTKYPPEDWHNKEHLYNWLDKFYNRKNRINK